MRRRRFVVLVVLLAIVAAVAFAAFFRGPGDAQAVGAAVTPAARPKVVAKPKTPVAEEQGRPSDKARLKLRAVISGNISPKSVASSGAGYVTAQNMMYRHSVTVYDVRSLKLVKTISDAVKLRALGYPSYPGTSRGAPVEAAFSPDGRYAYVSNYSMYGQSFGPDGSDSCTRRPATTRASSTGSTCSA